jgi:hypothetical protein
MDTDGVSMSIILTFEQISTTGSTRLAKKDSRKKSAAQSRRAAWQIQDL